MEAGDKYSDVNADVETYSNDTSTENELEHLTTDECAFILPAKGNEDPIAYGSECCTALPVYNVSQDKQPYELAYSRKEFGSFFLKGCKWSREGSQLLTCADDKRIRVFSLPQQFYTGDFSQAIPEMNPSVTVKEGGTIYDYAWNPLMDREDACTCTFLTSAQLTPIHLWDSVVGELKSSYKIVNQMDEIDTAYSVAFTPDGSFIFAGSTKQISIFDAAQPGKQLESFKTHKKRQAGQIGIISCFDFFNQTFAAGSYSKTIGIYDQRNNKQTMILDGHSGGVTHIKYSPDGNLLYSGARKDNELLVWDMRTPGSILAVLQRNVQTNQRMYFDLDPSGRYVATGHYDGSVALWDMNSLDYSSTEQISQSLLNFNAHHDCVNGISFHPTLAMLATTSGKRSSTGSVLSSSSDSNHSDDEDLVVSDNSVKLWWLGE